MATLNENFFSELLSPKAAKWSAGVAFDRSNGLPLDQWSVFQTKTAAEEYLSNSKAYPGQVIAYAEADGSMTACVLSQNAEGTALTLKQIGIIPSGDAKTIEVTADGQISIYGFGDATTGYLPRKAEDGTLEWVPISAVVQGDGNKITTLTSSDNSVIIEKTTDTDTSLVYDLKVTHPDAPEYAIAKDAREEGATETKYHLTKDGTNVDVEIVVPDAYNDTALAGRVKTLEDAGYQTATDVNNAITTGIANKADKATTLAGYGIADAYTKEEVNTELAKKAAQTDLEALQGRVDAFLTGTGTEAALDSLQELINYINTHDDVEISTLIADLDALEAKVDTGDQKVSEYVTAAIDALKIGDYAKAADLTTLAGRVKTLEEKPFDTYATKSEVETVDGKFANYTTTTDLNTALAGKVDDADLANYYTKGEIDGKNYAVEATTLAGYGITDAYTKTDIENKGYAVASEVEDTYATKQEIADAGYAVAETVNGELAKKLEKVTIAHASENVTEGVTYSEDGKTANVVVDTYTKNEVYTKTQVDTAITNRIKEFTGGESAKDVLGELRDYKKANDTEIYGAEKVASWTNDEGVYTPDYTKDSRIDANDAAIKLNAKGINDLAVLVGSNSDYADKKEGTLAYRIGALEAHDAAHTIEFNALSGTVGQQTKDIAANAAAINKINTADLPALTAAIQAEENARKAAIGDVYAAIEAVADTIDFTPYATNARVDAIYKVEGETKSGVLADAVVAIAANTAAIEAIYKAGEGDAAATGLLADEIARATKAEKELDDAIKLLTNGAGTEEIDSVMELIDYVNNHGTTVKGITDRLDGHDELLAGIGGDNQPETVLAAIQAAAYELNEFGEGTLGGIRGATYIQGEDIDDKIAKPNMVYAEAGEGMVKAVSTDTLVQGELELVLNGGSADTGVQA